jgi:hypothetical protein
MDSLLVIVPCGQSKIWDTQPNSGSVRAAEAYTGAPFKVNRRYAEHFADVWRILSAKYGFIAPDFEIPGPYNVTFKSAATNPVSPAVLHRQVCEQDLGRFARVIGLGGSGYRSMIEQAFAGTSSQLHFPFAGLPIGKAMQATNEAIRSGDPFGLPAEPTPGAAPPITRPMPTAVPSSTYPRPQAPTADDFERELRSILREARAAGSISVELVSGDLHRRVGGYPGPNHRMPVCCAVMRRLMGPADTILRKPPSGNGATLTIRYRLAR